MTTKSSKRNQGGTASADAPRRPERGWFFKQIRATRARDLMIEFVGSEPAAQLRDQFTA
jgi:hypothetical protein